MSGPGAELFAIMAVIMRLCNKIQEQSAHLTMLSTGVSLAETNNAAQDTINAGDNQAGIYLAQGIQSFAQGTAGLAQFAGSAQASSRINAETEGPLQNIGKQNDFISAMNGTDAPAGAAAGEEGAPNLTEEPEDDVSTRMTALRQSHGSDFDSTNPDDKEAAARLGQGDDGQEFIQSVQKNRDLNQSTVNTLRGELQSKMQMFSLISQAVTGAASGGANLREAALSKDKSFYDAAVTREQWGSQNATACAQTTAQMLEKWFETLKSAVEALGAASRVAQ
jgi:hypothetical protein